MPDFEIICLANSRKYSARCIAGLRTDGQGWVRPVGWTPDGGLTPNNYWLDNGTEPQVLDVIRLECARPHPKPHHPEDWLLAAQPWKLQARPASVEQVEFLRKSLVIGPALLGDTGSRIPAAHFKTRSAAASLALLAPENLCWEVQDFNGKRRVLAQFSLCGADYSLSLTDPTYEQKTASLPFGKHPRRAGGIPDSAAVWLTVSLGEPYQKEARAEAYCYKLVAAVIVLPGTERLEIPAPDAAKIAPLPPQTKPKSERMATLRLVHARNFERWSDTEDERLIVMAKSGMTAEAIAKLLQRSESAVVSRVGKLVLEKYRDLL